MAELGSFFNSKNGDRKYNAEDWASYFKQFFVNGIFNGQLQVVANVGMSVILKKGCAWIEGYMYRLTEDKVFNLLPASGSLNRYETILIRLDKTNRKITAYQKSGLYATGEPQPPEVLRHEKGGIYELQLARIYVAAGTTGITQSMITDTRMDPSVCGWVCGTVDEIDFEQITTQFRDYLKKFEADNLDGFHAWFEHIKDQLSEDAAGNLQLQIDGLGNTYQKKNVVEGVIYEELYLARVYVLKLLTNTLLLAGTSILGEGLSVSCELSTYGDIVQAETIRISWCSGEDSATCMDGAGMSLGQIPVICMYKNGMYCINVMEVLKQVATFAFSRIEFRSKSAGTCIFKEKMEDAHGAIANVMKQIGSTPLGYGDSTLTGAIAELLESMRILSILYPESRSQMKRVFTSTSAATKEVIYEARTDCFVSFGGFAQYLSPTENAIVLCNILVEEDMIQAKPDGSQTPLTRSVTVTAITEKAAESGINLPFDVKLKMRAGEVLKLQHAHFKGGAAIQMNLHYFLNVIS